MVLESIGLSRGWCERSVLATNEYCQRVAFVKNSLAAKDEFLEVCPLTRALPATQLV
jgi:hypothetical protein